MSEIFARWALGINGIIILSLVGVIWRMLGSRLERIEQALLKDIERQEAEIKDLRVRKQDTIEVIHQQAGRISSIEEDVQNLRQKAYLIEQLLHHRNKDD